MSIPARWTLNRTPITYRENFRLEWSGPHLRVMQALIDAGINVTSEDPIICEPCGQVGCHHEWKTDNRVVGSNILVEVHRFRNWKDIDKQVRRKRCLENSGWIVVTVTDKDPPELAVQKVKRALELTEAVTEGATAP